MEDEDAMTQLLSAGRATIHDLLTLKERAELIDGRIVQLMPMGLLPNRIAGRIFRELSLFAEQYLQGEAFTDSIGYAVGHLPSGRQSFSPDVSYFEGEQPQNLMRFIEGPPTFAVEVRSECDYSVAAEQEMELKREDYFVAGTKAVWDVDAIHQTIQLFIDDAIQPVATFRPGDVAHADIAVPGWKLDVAHLFR